MAKQNGANTRAGLRGAAHAGLALALGLALSGTAAAAGGNGLRAAVRQGHKLFGSTSLGANGRSCASCHVNDGKTPGALPNGKHIPSLRNAAAIFPRYSAKAGKVRTMSMQINHCIVGGLGGMPLAYDSPKLVALDAYLHSLAHGEPIHMGAKPK